MCYVSCIVYVTLGVEKFSVPEGGGGEVVRWSVDRGREEGVLRLDGG